MTALNNRVAIIGGGVSGMAAAHYLLQAGRKVDLYEGGSALGGRMGLGRFKEEEVCFGGKNIGYGYKEFRGFLKSYGAPDYEYFGINSARLERGKIKAFNSQNKFQSFLTLATTATPQDILRLWKSVKSVKAERLNGDTAGPWFAALKDQQLSTYFSPKFLEKIIRPLTVRMNGAEPQDISLENFGTHLKMLTDEYEQLKTPVADILSNFQNTPDVTCYMDCPVATLSEEKREYKLVTPKFTQNYKDVILALTAPQASLLLESANPSASQALRHVRYFPVGIILAEYKEDVFGKDIRALVLGPESPISNIGAYASTQLNRVRYSFSGESAAELLHENLDEADLLDIAEQAAAPHFNIQENKCLGYKLKYWPQGLCAYTTNETAFQTELKQSLEATSSLHLTGDYLKGASIENCFRASKACVQKLLERRIPNLEQTQKNGLAEAME